VSPYFLSVDLNPEPTLPIAGVTPGVEDECSFWMKQKQRKNSDHPAVVDPKPGATEYLYSLSVLLSSRWSVTGEPMVTGPNI
jgi:hypothetical protein